MCTKSCFNMSDGDLMIERGKRPRKGRRRIAVDEDEVGAILLEHLVDALHGARGDVKEGLPRRHDVEVVVGNDVKEMEHLIEHLPMLCRHERLCLNLLRMARQLHDDGRHLDRLRARSKDRHDFDFAGHSPLLLSANSRINLSYVSPVNASFHK